MVDLLIDLSDLKDESQPSQNETGESIHTIPIASSSISGFQLSISSKDIKGFSEITNHTEGIDVRVGDDNLIIIQRPQLGDGRSHLRLVLPIDNLLVSHNQERALNVDTKPQAVPCLEIKLLADFESHIVDESCITAYQSQDRGLVEICCSLYATKLSKDTKIQITEVCRDIWGDIDKIAELKARLDLSSGSKAAKVDSNMYTASTNDEDIWLGLESLDKINKKAQVQNKILDTGVPVPWWKPELVQPRPKPAFQHKPSINRRYTNRYNNGYRGGFGRSSGSEAEQKSQRPSSSPNPVSYHTSNISSIPQLPEKLTMYESEADRVVTTDFSSQDEQSMGSVNHDVEVLSDEQSLRQLAANAQLFWQEQGVKKEKRRHREPNLKLTSSQEDDIPTDINTSSLSEGVEKWRGFAVGRGGEARQPRDARGGYQGRYNNSHPSTGGGRGRGRLQYDSARSHNAADSSVDSHNPFPQQSRTYSPKRVGYNGREPFGGWNRYKNSQEGKSGGSYGAESNVGFQQGFY